MTISTTTTTNNLNRMQLIKCLRRPIQQFCLKFIIAFICCTSLCLICYLVETNNQLVFEVEHSSEKLVQIQPIHGRGYRDHEPWPTRVALNQHGEVDEAEEDEEVEKLVQAILTEEGSGLGSTFIDSNNNNNEDEIPVKVRDSLEQLYTTIADENFNMWTDSSSVVSTTTTTKEEAAAATTTNLNIRKRQNDLIEKYIMEHKAQTIDTSNEEIKNYSTTTTTTTATTLAAVELETEITMPAEKDKEFLYTTSKPLSDNKEDVEFVVSPVLASEEGKDKTKIDEHSIEKEEVDIIATPPRPLSNAYKEQSVEKLPFDNDLWFTDDDLTASLERLLMKSDAEDEEDLVSLYNAEEPALFPEDYSFHEEPRVENVGHGDTFVQDFQQPWSYSGPEEDEAEEELARSPVDAQHLPQFIEHLMGHLGKMSRLFTPPPATYHRIPGAIYPTSYHNHLTNFRDAYADEHQHLASAKVSQKQQAITKRKTATIPMASTTSTDYVDPVFGTWFSEQPKELKDAATIFKILFPRN